MAYQNKKSLLIVEDDTALGDVLSRAMSRRGYDIYFTTQRDDALEKIELKAFDCAILDLNLPDGNGLDLIIEIKNRNPDSKIVVLTGYGSIPQAVAATQIGAFDFLTKPASAQEIADVLETPSGMTPPPPVDPTSPRTARIEHIARILQEKDENISQAAIALSMHRRTLQRIIKREIKQ